VIHPNTETGPRSWPAAKWRDLARMIVEKTRHRLVLLGDASQARALEDIRAQLPKGSVEIVDAGDLDAVSSWLNSSQLFIGHDSGTAHLAAAMGLRTVVIWGIRTRYFGNRAGKMWRY